MHVGQRDIKFRKITEEVKMNSGLFFSGRNTFICGPLEATNNLAAMS